MGTQRCTSGDIYLDGTGISSVPLRSLRDSLGVVFQENFVFDGTIQENILFGYGGSQSDIIDAAKDAGIHDFIMSLPEAYNTVIGKETTVDLSGGQLQRICGISRALARKPKLLLLDEATSALDHVAERQFFDTIERLRDKGLTVISITHHTATTVNADQILVLDQGVIAKSGTFEELTSDANKDGLFARLVEASGRSSSKEGSNDTQGISFASNDGDDGGTGDTVLHLEAEMTPMQ